MVRLPRGDGRRIESTFHFVPLHSSPYGQKALGYRRGDFPITERAAASLVRLPLHTQLTMEDIEFILKELAQVLREWV